MPLSTKLIVSPRRVAGSHRRTRLGSMLCLFPPGSECLLAESLTRTEGQGLGPRFASLSQAQRVSSTSRVLAPPHRAWVHALPLSTRLSLSPRLFAGSHRRTILGSTLCLSPPGSACLLVELLARTARQGLGLRFVSLHQAQHISSLSRGLAPQDKAWVHTLPLSSKLSASPRRVTGLHPQTWFDSTLCLFPPGSACLLAESRGVATQDKYWVYVLPLSTRLSVSPRPVTGMHRRTRFGSTLCLSPPSSALLLAKSKARTAGHGLGLRFASLHQAQHNSSPSRVLALQDKAVSTLCLSPPSSALLLAESRACTPEQGLRPRFASLLQAQRFSLSSCGLAPQDKAWVYALPLSTRLSVSLRRVAGSHRRTLLGSTLCLSPPGSAYLLFECSARTAGKGFRPSFASLHEAQCVSSPSRGLEAQDKS